MATPTNLPAAQTTGNVLTAAYMNDLRGAFRILQVVQGVTNTPVSSTTTTYVDSGLTATITPQSSSSKILVLVNQVGGDKNSANVNNAINLRLVRGASQIALIAHSAGYTGTLLNLRIAAMSTCYLDSPATTSATTYKIQIQTYSPAMFVNYTYLDDDATYCGRVASNITVMEILA
jgi:hypothetical protein